MEYFAKSDIGKIRNKNQDQVAVNVNGADQLLAIVCDGMGGHKAGEVASRAMINYMTGCFQGHPGFENGKEIQKWMEETIQNGHAFVKKLASTTEEQEGMGTTIVAAMCCENTIYLAHVGDSRAYYYQEELLLLTKDHTLLNLLLDQGSITPEQAEDFEQKNVLTQAIGATQGIEIAQQVMEVENGYLLLCSDGLFNMVSKEEIKGTIQQNNLIEDIGNILIDKANDYGGRDNISVVLVKLIGGIE